MLRPFTAVLAAATALVTLLAAPAGAHRDGDVAGGSTTGLSGILLKGCHRYSYAYAVHVPTQDWLLEVSIVDRRGHAVASFVYLGSSDPTTQTSDFRLCRNATVPGTFRIRAILNWYDDPLVPIPAPVPVTRFRLARS